MNKILQFLLILFLIPCLAACSEEAEQEPVPEEPETLILNPARFVDLPGWESDDIAQALPALERSCARILKASPEKAFGIADLTYADWHPACTELTSLEKPVSSETARNFLNKFFVPWAVESSRTGPDGLFTGYYEPLLRGSLTRQGPYQTPLHSRPEDLVMVDLGQFRETLKGQRIAGRVEAGRLVPYEDRAALSAKEDVSPVLVWVDDPVDAFFLHIQGSGRVALEDGTILRVGYAGQNGHVYTPIGRELILRGELTRENVSMQAIRQWLADHPEQVLEILNVNRSYVFFQILEGDGPLGGEGLPLTARRSLAVDRSYIPYGVPVWIDVESPENPDTRIQRLMVAQDTGGAIRGPVRGDFFWGYGPEAEEMAGKMASRGRDWVLLPTVPQKDRSGEKQDRNESSERTEKTP